MDKEVFFSGLSRDCRLSITRYGKAFMITEEVGQMGRELQLALINSNREVEWYSKHLSDIQKRFIKDNAKNVSLNDTYDNNEWG